MNFYRTTALAAAACAVAVALTACDGTFTTTSVVSPVSTATGSRLTAGSTDSVSSPVGDFPVPPGAQVINEGNNNGSYDIIFGSVTPSEVSSFYTGALPRAGYTIISDTSGSGDFFSGTGIWFNGHGYNGQIGAFSGGTIFGVTLPGSNFVEITLTSQ